MWPRVRGVLKRTVERLPTSLEDLIRDGYHRHLVRTGRFLSEEPDLHLLLAVLRPGDWVIDIGANIGHYTIPLAQATGPSGRVIAVEPLPASFRRLVANVASAQLQNVTLINIAASSSSSIQGIEVPTFTDGKRNPYCAHLAMGDASAAVDRVLCLPLDMLKFPQPIRAIKVDAEGHEGEILDGMQELILKDLPLLVLEESPSHRHAILAEAGYRELKLRGSPNRIFATDEKIQSLRSFRMSR